MRSLLIYLFTLYVAFFSAFSAANYKTVKGLKPKENRIEDEGTREIVIRKRETISYENENSSLFGLQEGCSAGECNYISFAFTNQMKTQISKTAFGELEKLDFAIPISDKRFGVEMTFGGKFSNPHFGYEIGIMYDLAYFKNVKEDEFGLHAIAPSVRLLFDAFPEESFSIYLGAELGFAVMDFVYGDQYDVQYAPRFGGIAGVSYKLGEVRSYELFFGYRIVATPSKTFTINEVEYETGFAVQGLQFGIKIKI